MLQSAFVAFVLLTAFWSGLNMRMLVDLPTLLYLLIGTALLSALRLRREMTPGVRRKLVIQNLLISTIICLMTGILGILSLADDQIQLIRGLGVAVLAVPYAGVLWYGIHLYYQRSTSFEESPVADVETKSEVIGKTSMEVEESWGLTAREKEIVEALSKGWTNKEIGEALFISETTVKKHLANVFAKTGVASRQALIVKLHQRE